MREKFKHNQEFFDELAKKNCVLASSYLQMEEGLSEEDALKKLIDMPKEKILLLAKKGERKVLDSTEVFHKPQENVALMKKIKKDQPEEYEKLMDKIKEENPKYYEYLKKLHG